MGHIHDDGFESRWICGQIWQIMINYRPKDLGNIFFLLFFSS